MITNKNNYNRFLQHTATVNDTCKQLQYIHLILLIISVSTKLELPLSATVAKRCKQPGDTGGADTWVKAVPGLLIMKQRTDF